MTEHDVRGLLITVCTLLGTMSAIIVVALHSRNYPTDDRSRKPSAWRLALFSFLLSGVLFGIASVAVVLWTLLVPASPGTLPQQVAIVLMILPIFFLVAGFIAGANEYS